MRKAPPFLQTYRMGGPDRIMVISCNVCGARFRFDRSLIGEAAGARLRCRRCGGFIEVRNPEATVRRRSVEPPRSPGEERPAKTPTVGDTVAPSPAGIQVGPSAPPAPPSTLPERETEKAVAALRTERWTWGKKGFRAQRNDSLVTYAALALGLLLLGIGGLGYIGLRTGERNPGNAAVSGSGTTGFSSVSGDRYGFERIETYYSRSRESGNLFILKGRVAEAGRVAGKRRIRVHATLLNPDNRLIAEKTVYAGITVPDEVLLYQDRAFIEQALSGNGGEASGKGIPPDSPLPFMVVFFDVPKNISSYRLAADEVQ
jgi:predicted Zn finger-like uncharacterized protein